MFLVYYLYCKKTDSGPFSRNVNFFFIEQKHFIRRCTKVFLLGWKCLKNKSRLTLTFRLQKTFFSLLKVQIIKKHNTIERISWRRLMTFLTISGRFESLFGNEIRWNKLHLRSKIKKTTTFHRETNCRQILPKQLVCRKALHPKIVFSKDFLKAGHIHGSHVVDFYYNR